MRVAQPQEPHAGRLCLTGLYAESDIQRTMLADNCPLIVRRERTLAVVIIAIVIAAAALTSSLYPALNSADRKRSFDRQHFALRLQNLTLSMKINHATRTA